MYPPGPNDQNPNDPGQPNPAVPPGQPGPGYPPPAQPPNWPPAPSQQPGYPPGYGGYPGGIYPVQVNGTTILLLGILSLVVCSFCGPVAWVMGNNALAAIDSGQADPTQRGNVVAGRICGMIGTGFLALGLLWLVFVMGMAIIGAASHH